MANVLTYKGSGVVQIMSTTELEALSQAVLENMALNDGPGGIYTSNVGNASFTLIGTFTDTRYAGNIGDGNVTILSSEYNLYQDLTTPSGTDSPRAITYTSASTPMGEATDTELNEIADAVLTYCVNSEGPHSFVLQSSAPVDGGTWTNLGQLKDIYSGGIETPKYLYKKLTSGVYDLRRPLKYSGSGVLQEFSTTEIQQIAKRVRQRIVNTGVGKYQFQSSAPTPGTWVSKGSVIDTRATAVPNVTYTSSAYNTVYTANDTSYSIGNYYLGDTDIPYTRDITSYLGPVDVAYTLSTPTYYTNVYTGVGQLGYTAPVFTSFSGTVNQGFAGTTPATFAGYYTGPGDLAYTGITFIDFSSAYGGDLYTSATQYTRDLGFYFAVPQYTGTARLFDGTSSLLQESLPGFVTRYTLQELFYSVVGVEYSNNVLPAGTDLLVYVANYENQFAGSPYFAATNYTGPWNPGFPMVRHYYAAPPINQVSTGGVLIFPGYDGAGGTYAKDFGSFVVYTHDVISQYGTEELYYTLGPYTGVMYYTLDTTYTGPIVIYTGTYTGITPANYSGPGGTSTYVSGYYTGVVPATYTGITPTTYTGLTTTYYTGPGGTAYFGAIVYTGVTNTYYVGTVANGNYYVGTLSNPLYTGVRPAANYTIGEAIYTGEGTAYDIDYIGLYTGSSISDTPVTVSTITLWRRVA